MDKQFNQSENDPFNWNYNTPDHNDQKKDHFLPADFRNLRILLVEDNKVNQMLSRKILSSKGFAVDTADNGMDALDKFDSARYDLILLDLHMPIMSGFEFMETIRRKRPKPISETAVIALTAYASFKEKEMAISLGVDHYLNKPCCQHELMNAIVHQLEQHKILK